MRYIERSQKLFLNNYIEYFSASYVFVTFSQHLAFRRSSFFSFHGPFSTSMTFYLGHSISNTDLSIDETISVIWPLRPSLPEWIIRRCMIESKSQRYLRVVSGEWDGSILTTSLFLYQLLSMKPNFINSYNLTLKLTRFSWNGDYGFVRQRHTSFVSFECSWKITYIVLCERERELTQLLFHTQYSKDRFRKQSEPFNIYSWSYGYWVFFTV